MSEPSPISDTDSDPQAPYDRDEWSIKQDRLTHWLDRHDLDGVLLWQRGNFAWATGGGDNHVFNASPEGIAAILATREGRACVTANIETQRLLDEELDGSDIPVIEGPWHDPAGQAKAFLDHIGDLKLDHAKIAADAPLLQADLPSMPGDFAQLRWQLTPQEQDRYREGGQRTAGAMEQACEAFEQGMDEHDLAAIQDHCLRAAGLTPMLALVACDERIDKYRHPIPTAQTLERYAMVVTCSGFGGLISNVTRFVHFGEMPEQLTAVQQAVADVDTVANLSCRPGRTLGDVLADIRGAYKSAGFEDEWQLHHQGGSTGYAGRDVFAVPGNATKVLADQAFAWNPSITGYKSEDTVLVDDEGLEILTGHSDDWPTIVGRSEDGELPRPGVLIK
ncbi:MAG: M24 family metallopeptidase [Planctomycetota bacterium]